MKVKAKEQIDRLGPEITDGIRNMKEQASDGVTAEVVGSAVSTVVPALALTEEQLLVLKSVIANVVFNTTYSIMNGDFNSLHRKSTNITNVNATSPWPSPADCCRFVIRHALIPSVAHCMVHDAVNAAASTACVVSEAVNQVTSICHF